MAHGFAFGTSTNPPLILENYNFFVSDAARREAVVVNGGAWNDKHTAKFGEILGRSETPELGTSSGTQIKIQCKKMVRFRR